jgi:hypothetical protein
LFEHPRYIFFLKVGLLMVGWSVSHAIADQCVNPDSFPMKMILSRHNI